MTITNAKSHLVPYLIPMSVWLKHGSVELATYKHHHKALTRAFDTCTPYSLIPCVNAHTSAMTRWNDGEWIPVKITRHTHTQTSKSEVVF